MFWIVTWLISHRFRDKRRFLSKIVNFSHPRVYPPLEFGIGLGPLKGLIRRPGCYACISFTAAKTKRYQREGNNCI